VLYGLQQRNLRRTEVLRLERRIRELEQAGRPQDAARTAN
jgi:hypothetical protein